LRGLIDWSPVEQTLAGLYPGRRGEPAWPPLAMLRAMLLSVWYDLSGIKLAEVLDDRASFRVFCGFPATEPTPERTVFVRFRRALAAGNPDAVLFDAVTDRLRARSVRVKAGKIVDATIVASAGEGDCDARWVRHKGRPAVHGYKAHAGADADTALVERIAVTPANVNDGRGGPGALPDDPGEVFADSAYRGDHFGSAVRSKRGTPRIVATGMWVREGEDIRARLRALNGPIHHVRGRIEKISVTWKRRYGLRRMRRRGLAKASIQIHVTAIAYNLRRCLTIVTASVRGGGGYQNPLRFIPQGHKFRSSACQTGGSQRETRKTVSFQKPVQFAHRSHYPEQSCCHSAKAELWLSLKLSLQ
jgi:transposase, IS5 family